MSNISIASLPRITPDKLAPLVRSKDKNLAVIDVRDSDYVGGHIAGGTNVPTHTHDYKMPELVRTLQDKDTVVFHCALSQQRGPSAALKYLRAREIAGRKGQTVYVLDGGFVKWQETYGEDKDLTEDYQKDIWEFGY
ncbi:Cdc25 phosphatase Ibp1 [Taxawa tesnikishii (nom. ined.)]|nr:Cdc25 phosphatase Ibp1 [Dothideales sp. JES 119]